MKGKKMIKRHFTVLAIACMASFYVISVPASDATAADVSVEKVTADLSKPYTLMADASKMIEEGKSPSGDFIFKAAIAADWAGDEVKSRDFLAYYLDKEKGMVGVRDRF